jgi:hypothetical protein
MEDTIAPRDEVKHALNHERQLAITGKPRLVHRCRVQSPSASGVLMDVFRAVLARQYRIATTCSGRCPPLSKQLTSYHARDGGVRNLGRFFRALWGRNGAGSDWPEHSVRPSYKRHNLRATLRYATRCRRLAEAGLTGGLG